MVLIKDKLRGCQEQCNSVHTPFMFSYFRPSSFKFYPKLSMKDPVTFLTCFTFLMKMIFRAHVTEWVTERQTDTMNKPASLLSESSGQRPGHIVRARFKPREAVHM